MGVLIGPQLLDLLQIPQGENFSCFPTGQAIAKVSQMTTSLEV